MCRQLYVCLSLILSFQIVLLHAFNARRALHPPAPHHCLSMGGMPSFGKALHCYDKLLLQYPLATKMVSSGLIGGLGDLLIQRVEANDEKHIHNNMKKKRAIDLRRLFIFTAVSALYFAPFIHYWFAYLENLSFSRPRSKLYKSLVMISLDQLIGAILLKSGFFYAFTIMERLTPPYSSSDSSRKSVLSEANELVRTKLWPTLKANWLYWPLVNWVNFMCVPAPYRVLFSNTAALLWNMFLSNLVNK